MWKNISSYSQGEKDRTPTTFEFRAGRLRIVVTRHIHFPKDVWVASAEPFFKLIELKNKDSEAARVEALMLLRSHLDESRAALNA